jgi:hypothetical protein
MSRGGGGGRLRRRAGTRWDEPRGAVEVRVADAGPFKLQLETGRAGARRALVAAERKYAA